MELSIYLGQVFGLYMMIMGIYYLMKREFIISMIDEYFQNVTISIIGGVLALIIGLLIVVGHNVWELNWRVLITIFGYLSLIKGLTLLFAPEYLETISRRITAGKGTTITGVIMFLIGFYLAVQTFFLV